MPSLTLSVSIQLMHEKNGEDVTLNDNCKQLTKRHSSQTTFNQLSDKSVILCTPIQQYDFN